MLDLNVLLQLMMCCSKHATCITLNTGLPNALSHDYSIPLMFWRNRGNYHIRLSPSWFIARCWLSNKSIILSWLICYHTIKIPASYWVFFSYMLSELLFLFKSITTVITELHKFSQSIHTWRLDERRLRSSKISGESWWEECHTWRRDFMAFKETTPETRCGECARIFDIEYDSDNTWKGITQENKL